MSIGIYLIKSDPAEMDQTRDAANWLCNYVCAEDDTHFWIDSDRIAAALRQAREDIKEKHIPKQFTDNIEGFTLERLIEVTDNLARQLCDLLRDNNDGFELEVYW